MIFFALVLSLFSADIIYLNESEHLPLTCPDIIKRFEQPNDVYLFTCDSTGMSSIETDLTPGESVRVKCGRSDMQLVNFPPLPNSKTKVSCEGRVYLPIVK